MLPEKVPCQLSWGDEGGSKGQLWRRGADEKKSCVWTVDGTTTVTRRSERKWECVKEKWRGERMRGGDVGGRERKWLWVCPLWCWKPCSYFAVLFLFCRPSEVTLMRQEKATRIRLVFPVGMGLSRVQRASLQAGQEVLVHLPFHPVMDESSWQTGM